jgi:hypothetical protein
MKREIDFRISLLVAVSLGLSVTSSIGGPVCPNPARNLQAQDASVEPQTVAFHHGGLRYTVDLFSAFAPQSSRAGAPWCIRYEAENTSSSDIEKFSLPVVPMEDDPLRAGVRDSLVVTRSSLNPPAVAETVVYAFKSNAMRTRAYQADLLPTLKLTRRYAEVVSPQRSDHQQRERLTAEHILVKEPTDLFVLGGDFASGDMTMTVASSASYNGKEYVIRLGIEIEGGPIKIVQAPSSMLRQAKDPDDLLSFLQQREAFNKPIEGRQVTRVFSSTALPMNLLYVVDQPVSIVRADGDRICIMTPAYSPAPIPPSTFSCDFIR